MSFLLFSALPSQRGAAFRSLAAPFLVLICGIAAPPLFGGDDLFPSPLVDFEPAAGTPVFTAGKAGDWDARIRERGWILRESDGWHLWYTGYDGTREGIRRLGYATSPDGRSWTRHDKNPLIADLWVEDMMIVKSDGVYWMFAEGVKDRAQLLRSTDRTRWSRVGTLDIRKANGEPIDEGPYGTPTAWRENGKWHLFYERSDLGIWLARSVSDDLLKWQNVQDAPVLAPSPGKFDAKQVAFNQVIKIGPRYYAYYHGSAGDTTPSRWAPGIATSTDLLQWQKFDGNPLRPVQENRSSGILLQTEEGLRFYTMHNQVDLFLPRKERK